MYKCVKVLLKHIFISVFLNQLLQTPFDGPNPKIENRCFKVKTF